MFEVAVLQDCMQWRLCAIYSHISQHGRIAGLTAYKRLQVHLGDTDQANTYYMIDQVDFGSGLQNLIRDYSVSTL